MHGRIRRRDDLGDRASCEPRERTFSDEAENLPSVEPGFVHVDLVAHSFPESASRPHASSEELRTPLAHP